MHTRRSPRLRDYDYTQYGAYFVTIATYRMAQLFGAVANGKIYLNDLGRLVDEEWQKTAEIRPNVEVDHFVVMPNHLHGILFLAGRQHTGPLKGKITLPANSLGTVDILS